MGFSQMPAHSGLSCQLGSLYWNALFCIILWCKMIFLLVLCQPLWVCWWILFSITCVNQSTVLEAGQMTHNMLKLSLCRNAYIQSCSLQLCFSKDLRGGTIIYVSCFIVLLTLASCLWQPRICEIRHAALRELPVFRQLS